MRKGNKRTGLWPNTHSHEVGPEVFELEGGVDADKVSRRSLLGDVLEGEGLGLNGETFVDGGGVGRVDGVELDEVVFDHDVIAKLRKKTSQRLAHIRRRGTLRREGTGVDSVKGDEP